MNQNTEIVESQNQAIRLAEIREAQYSTFSLEPAAMQNMMAVADVMAKATVTVPAHFRGKASDCLAVVMQAVRWRMDPFVVASKTHVTQGGILGYEAQLINAVINASGAVQRQPEYEFIGDWKKILGKVAEKTSDKGGKYYVATWDKKDEDGLGVIVSATLQGETEPRSVTIMMSQAYPRFSTQWATDPQQQITYLATRKFSRRYCPGAIMGVYTPEELQEVREKEVQGEVVTERKTGTAALNDAVKSQATAGEVETLDGVLAAIKAAETARDMQAASNRALMLLDPKDQKAASEAYRARAAELKKQAAPTAQATEQKATAAPESGAVIDGQTGEIFDQAEEAGKMVVDFGQVKKKLESAQDMDELAVAADLIQYVPGTGNTEDLNKVYKRRSDEFKAAQ